MLETALGELLPESPQSTLHAAARHLCLLSGAKRARPRLTHAWSLALDVPRARALEVALCAELIHSASLLHDDVVDAGTLRRGEPTSNALFGNHAAVLSGDLLICLALQALRAHPPATLLLGVDVVATMTRAAILEVEARANARLDLAAWRHIAVGKTGVLFGFCGAALAAWRDDEEAARRLREVGERLGVAFQMADDLADLGPGTGKDTCADLRQRNPSSLLALATAMSPAFQRRLTDAWSGADALSDDEVTSLSVAVLESGAAERLRALLLAEVQEALSLMAPYRGQPGVDEIERWAGALCLAARVAA